MQPSQEFIAPLHLRDVESLAITALRAARIEHHDYGNRARGFRKYIDRLGQIDSWWTPGKDDEGTVESLHMLRQPEQLIIEVIARHPARATILPDKINHTEIVLSPTWSKLATYERGYKGYSSIDLRHERHATVDYFKATVQDILRRCEVILDPVRRTPDRKKGH